MVRRCSRVGVSGGVTCARMTRPATCLHWFDHRSVSSLFMDATTGYANSPARHGATHDTSKRRIGSATMSTHQQRQPQALPLLDGRLLVYVGVQVPDDLPIVLWMSDDGLLVQHTQIETAGQPATYVTVRYTERPSTPQDLAVVCAAFFAPDTRVLVLDGDGHLGRLVESPDGQRCTDLVAALLRGDQSWMTPSVS